MEKINGKLMLRIPLESGGRELVECSRGIGGVEGDFLNIVILDWLAEKHGISEGSTVDVDNADGKFNIRLSEADQAASQRRQIQDNLREARTDAIASFAGGVSLLVLALLALFRLPMYSVDRNPDWLGGGLTASGCLMVVLPVLFGVGLLCRARFKWPMSLASSGATTRKRRKRAAPMPPAIDTKTPRPESRPRQM